VDKETNTGKADFNYILKLEIPEGPTVAFRDWLMQDLYIELHHSKPVIKDKKNEDESVT
jgi:hypothetical protein